MGNSFKPYAVTLSLLLILLAPMTQSTAFAKQPHCPNKLGATPPIDLNNLLNGKNFELTASHLRILIAKQPANWQYHLALGCALADRAASIAYAATWTM